MVLLKNRKQILHIIFGIKKKNSIATHPQIGRRKSRTCRHHYWAHARGKSLVSLIFPARILFQAFQLFIVASTYTYSGSFCFLESASVGRGSLQGMQKSVKIDSLFYIWLRKSIFNWGCLDWAFLFVYVAFGEFVITL